VSVVEIRSQESAGGEVTLEEGMHMSLAFSLEAARSSDEPLVIGFLAAVKLPIEGLRGRFPEGYVVAQRQGVLVGVAGVELYDDVALLRSVAVVEGRRSLGVGRSLVENRLGFAKARGVERVFLLTTTAESYFSRLGFSPANRAEVSPALAASAEFASACPTSAACLVFAF
jgi:amino-acid N-acetyltransferase